MKNFMDKLDKKSVATFVIMLVALINQALTMAGKPIIKTGGDQGDVKK